VAPSVHAHQGIHTEKTNDRYQPTGHHPELRRGVEELTSLALEPPINGLDPSIVVQSCRLHLTPGVMTLAPPQSAGVPEQEQEQERRRRPASLRQCGSSRRVYEKSWREHRREWG